MKRLIITLFALLLTAGICRINDHTAWASEYGIIETYSYLPALTNTSVEERDGRRFLIRTYEGNPEYEPDFSCLIAEPFEHEGFLYTFNGLSSNEIVREEKRWERSEVSFSISDDNLPAVYAQLLSSIPFHGEDGFYGKLDLDYTAVWTEVEGYAAQSFTMTDSVTISGLSSNDSSNIPKTRVRSGVTMQLAGVDWTVQESTNIGYETIPTKYTAVANYSGRYSRQMPTGYLARALYGGEVTRAVVERVVYTLAYIGEPLTTPIPEPTTEPVFEPDDESDVTIPDDEDTPDKRSNLAAYIVIAAIILALAGLGVFAYIYLNNICVYKADGDDYRLIARRFMRLDNPVVDLRRLNFDEGELAILVKKRTVAEMYGKSIETIISDEYTHRCRVKKKDKDFWYLIILSGEESSPADDEPVSEFDGEES